MLKDSATRDDCPIRMQHGQPLRFGAPDSNGEGSKAVVRSAGGSVSIEHDVGADDPRVVEHDEALDALLRGAETWEVA